METRTAYIYTAASSMSFWQGRLGAFWLSEIAFWTAVATDGFSKISYNKALKS